MSLLLVVRGGGVFVTFCWSRAFVIFVLDLFFCSWWSGLVFLLRHDWHFYCSAVLCFFSWWWESWPCAPPLDQVYPFGDRFFIGISSSGFLYVIG